MPCGASATFGTVMASKPCAQRDADGARADDARGDRAARRDRQAAAGGDIGDAVAVPQILGEQLDRIAAEVEAGAQVDHLIGGNRSEEHTSELQSLMRISYAVFCLKKTKKNKQLHPLPRT